MTTQKLPILEKVGYSAADAAANFVFMSMILFQLNFYTDVMGLSATAAAAILLWPRLWDAIFDPIMGVLADRTRTRWGRFRPWILWTMIPWAVVMVLAYTTPKGWSMGALIAYAGITNTLLMTLYSMNNMPYSALGGVMTADLNERASLNSYRFIAVNIAQFIVGGFTLPLVAKFAATHDRAYGWQMTMTIWAVLCLILFAVTFLTTRERIQPVTEVKSSPKQDFSDLLKNVPWRVMAVMTLVHFAILSFRGGAAYNYFHHYADKAAMFDWVQQLGLTAPALAPGTPKPGGLLEWLGYVVHGTRDNLAASNVADVFNSIVNMIGTATIIIVIMLSASFARRFGKKAVAIWGFGLSAVNAFALYLLKPTDVNGMVILAITGAMVYAPTVPLIWAIFADVADYSELKTGRRFTGMVFATIGFALKAGLAIGSAGFLWIMAGFFKYDTQLPSAPDAIQGYRATTSIVVGILFAICTVLLLAYQLNKRATIEMADELAARRAKAANLKSPLPFTIAVALFVATGCANAQPTLKDTFAGKFLIGAALNESQFTEQNPVQTALIKQQFNSITPENVLKWEAVHPDPDRYDFAPGDRYVEFGEKNGMFIVGHTLVWHSQTPQWVFEDGNGNPADRATLLARMSNHIHTVVGRYKGRVKGWDVVNEALAENGSLRDSPWKKIIGEDYLVKAFEFAHAADPGAELYYNDYSLENPAKRNGAVKLVKKLQAAGVKVTGIGTQTHAKLISPSPQLVDETLTAFGKLGVKVMVTELDVDVLPGAGASQSADVSVRVAQNPALNPYTNGLPDAVQQALAKRYAELFAVYVKHSDVVERVTFWGVSDGDSWLNSWPVSGRTSHPLLFDRSNKPKPAFEAVINVRQ